MKKTEFLHHRHCVYNLHVHLPVCYPPKVAISKLVQALKGYSSLIIRKKNYPSIQKIFEGKLFGRHPILLAVVEEPQFLLLDNI